MPSGSIRFHALHEDAARKLAVASAVPSGTLLAVLNALVEIGGVAVTAIETSLGIANPVTKTANPSSPAQPAG